MNIALIFHNDSLCSDIKAQSHSFRNTSLSKQLNGFRLMIVNKKDKASVFWWEEREKKMRSSSSSSGASIKYSKVQRNVTL